MCGNISSKEEYYCKIVHKNQHWTVRSISGTTLETKKKKRKTQNGLFLEGLPITVADYEILSIIHTVVELPTTSSQADKANIVTSQKQIFVLTDVERFTSKFKTHYHEENSFYLAFFEGKTLAINSVLLWRTVLISLFPFQYFHWVCDKRRKTREWINS